MKIRIGFVSNSSASSFILIKAGLSEDVINQFDAWVDVHNDAANDGWIHVGKSAYFGYKDYHVEMPKSLRDAVEDKIEYGV